MFVCRTKMEPAVKIAGISKTYAGSAVVKAVSLEIACGETLGLLGPNGAGKTTLMKMIAGLVRPDAGRIEVFGRVVSGRSITTRSLVGLVPQDNNMERELTVEEALTIYGRLFAVPCLTDRLTELVDQFSLANVWRKKTGLLSGGTARRVLIARALLPGPQLLLLDEPTVGLDPDVRQELWQIVKKMEQSGKTIIITTHYMEEVEKLCRRVSMLCAGEVVWLESVGVSSGAELNARFVQLAKQVSA